MFPSKKRGELTFSKQRGGTEEMDQKPEVVQKEISTNSIDNLGRKGLAAQPENFESFEPKPGNSALASNRCRKIFSDSEKVPARNERVSFPSKSLPKSSNSIFECDLSAVKKKPDTNVIISSNPTHERSSLEDSFRVSNGKRKRSVKVKKNLDSSEDINVSAGYEPDTNVIVSSDPTRGRSSLEDSSRVSSEKRRSVSGNQSLDISEDVSVSTGPSGIRPLSLKQVGVKEEYFCRKCHQEFENSYDFDIHFETFHSKKVFRCDKCPRVFPRNDLLRLHDRTHTKKELFVCDVCGKEFTQKYDLECHYSCHTGEKPFVCEVCEKGFARKWSLIHHHRTHTGEMPFVCEVCMKGFNRKCTLDRHFRTHTGEKPFAHELCTKQFSRKEHLMTHCRTHTGERPFVCDVCNKDFSDRSHLTRHERSHTD